MTEYSVIIPPCQTPLSSLAIGAGDADVRVHGVVNGTGRDHPGSSGRALTTKRRQTAIFGINKSAIAVLGRPAWLLHAAARPRPPRPPDGPGAPSGPAPAPDPKIATGVGIRRFPDTPSTRPATARKIGLQVMKHRSGRSFPGLN